MCGLLNETPALTAMDYNETLLRYAEPFARSLGLTETVETSHRQRMRRDWCRVPEGVEGSPLVVALDFDEMAVALPSAEGVETRHALSVVHRPSGKTCIILSSIVAANTCPNFPWYPPATPDGLAIAELACLRMHNLFARYGVVDPVADTADWEPEHRAALMREAADALEQPEIERAAKVARLHVRAWRKHLLDCGETEYSIGHKVRAAFPWFGRKNRTRLKGES